MAVQQALTHALNLWKRISPKEHPNGAVVFCSEDLAELLHPPTPLKRRVYDCGRQFNTSVIQDAIDAQLGSTYGLIVVDGSDAAFGKVKGLGISSGPVILDLGHLGAHIQGRTRRGGQSASRYSRLRDESELAFLRKVAERAAILLTDVQGLIIAGKADMKHKLRAELSEPLQKHIICAVDLSCDAGPEALRQAALRAAETAMSAEHAGVECTLKHFLELTVKESLCCYGEMQTMKALEMGAVEQLLLSAELETRLAVDDWKALAALHGTHVVEIHPRSEQATRFCQSFAVGGCLRWPLEAHLLEDEDEDEEEPANEEESLLKPSELQGTQSPSGLKAATLQSSKDTEARATATMLADEVDRDSISTADPMEAADVTQKRCETLAWLQAELSDVLGEPSAAEALTACIEVVLSDEVSSRDEVLEGVMAVASAEGVPEWLVLELASRW